MPPRRNELAEVVTRDIQRRGILRDLIFGSEEGSMDAGKHGPSGESRYWDDPEPGPPRADQPSRELRVDELDLLSNELNMLDSDIIRRSTPPRQIIRERLAQIGRIREERLRAERPSMPEPPKRDDVLIRSLIDDALATLGRISELL